MKVKSADLTGSLTEIEYSSVFFIIVKGSSFDALEKFRKNLLIHLRKLGFQHTRILKDDISTSLALELYPLLNKVENCLRSFLVKFFIQKIGLNWWELTAPKTVQEKVKLRRSGNEPQFSEYIDCDVTFCDFDDLGELIYKQTTGFNSPDKIVDKIMNTSSIQELDKLKSELQGNYTKYFKESFQDKQFDKKWKELFAVRNRVAHNNLMTANDKKIAHENTEYIIKVIKDAEKLINNFAFTMEDKQAFFDASASIITDLGQNTNKLDDNETDIANINVLNKPRPKIIGKIDLKEPDEYNSFFKVPDEGIITEEISYFNKFGDDVSLKGVVESLVRKSYDRRLVYSLTNLMIDKGMLELYFYKNEKGFDTRGVKLIPKK
ncbi:MAG: hypothetical protein K2P54_09915 [Odoribacter sp.]|nr:hypothetical protein [Odoribacter sp.]